jgi:hypothetical protein
MLDALEPVPNCTTIYANMRDPLHRWARLSSRERHTLVLPFFFTRTQEGGELRRPTAPDRWVADGGGGGAMRQLGLARMRRCPWCSTERLEVAQPRETAAQWRARVVAMEQLRRRAAAATKEEHHGSAQTQWLP